MHENFFRTERRNVRIISKPEEQNCFRSCSIFNKYSQQEKEQHEKDKATEIQKELRMFQEKLSEFQILQENLQKKLNSVLDE